MSQKIGVVDVGGGLRAIYSAGVLDRCIMEGIHFDLGIGVSAGSANLVSYCAGQKCRNLRFFSQYALRKEYMSWGNLRRTGSYIDMDYIYGTLSNSGGEDPLDYEAACANPMELLVVATHADYGYPHYFTKADLAQDRYDAFKASCSIPLICKPYVIDGVPYFDGALADPVPVAKAFACGCDKVVLLLTKPRDTVRKATRDSLLSRGIRSRYPLAAAQLKRRAQLYNDSIALARDYEAQGKLLFVAPDDTCGVDTLSKDVKNLLRLYEKGIQDGGAIFRFLYE